MDDYLRSWYTTNPDYVRWAEAAPSEDKDIDWLELNRQLSDGSF